MLIYFILRTIDKKMYMCLDCHNGLSDSIVTGQLLDSLKHPRFESWNDTSLSNTFIVSIGYNGKEAQELAIKLLENYIDWTEQNPIVEDIHEPPSTEYAKAVLACSLKVQDIFAEEGLCHEQIRKRINHGGSHLLALTANSHSPWSTIKTRANEVIMTVWDYGHKTLRSLYRMLG
jgi:hypothetical protein